MKILKSLHMFTGIVVKSELNQYWSINPLIKTFFSNDVMPRYIVQLILEFLHFNDNVQCNPHDTNRNRLFKVQSVIDIVVNNLKAVYTRNKNNLYP